MDDAFFISRDARYVANELQQGDAAGAANRLREDCAHMNPGEFSQLLRETKADHAPDTLASIMLYRNGQVTVRSQDGRQFTAGNLPPLEMQGLVFPPPPPQYYPQPGPVYVGPPHPMWVPPGAYIQPAPLNNTTVDTVGGALIGGIIGSNGHGRNGALNGALIGAGAGLILGTAQDNANH